MAYQKNIKIVPLILILVNTLFCTSTINLEGEIHHPKTSDNWDLTLENLKPRKETISKKYPVIICHGLVGNRNYFKINEKKSIAYRLMAEGYDVWLLDLRGRADAGTPSLFFGDKKYDFSFDDYAKKDVDAAITFVLEKTGAEKVNWIGHSMGGMVVYTKIGTFNETRIANLVTVGSPFSFYSPTKYLQWLNMGSSLLDILPVFPSASLARLQSDYKIPIPKKPFLRLFYYSENTESDVEHKLKSLSTNNESPNVLKQFANGVKTGEIQSLDRNISYTPNLKNITIPVFLIAGRRDHLGTPSIVRQVYDNIGSSDKTILVAGRSEGFKEDYGHVDLVMGTFANKDINNPIIKWLNDRNK
ncbi:MAG: alpha/beta fold hydrolase [Leptospiraceae bacterium]|nr:alpha/beta fold hydrolase [Leptospiraceae bacterium]